MENPRGPGNEAAPFTPDLRHDDGTGCDGISEQPPRWMQELGSPCQALMQQWTWNNKRRVELDHGAVRDELPAGDSPAWVSPQRAGRFAGDLVGSGTLEATSPDMMTTMGEEGPPRGGGTTKEGRGSTRTVPARLGEQELVRGLDLRL
ncbi:hypothetical protein G7Z17_g4643 [Cylindrodendrum hubeiense]|uniref:Uncharacterized protein n=1 Tax=Cylindrodendrum hubeiense TaxID=595255 RepID=A0A9P5LGZ4_9HYPO|nr:hypothetical protein G7Z17_g4643 [Cylindrodendrum hubeiense]